MGLAGRSLRVLAGACVAACLALGAGCGRREASVPADDGSPAGAPRIAAMSPAVGVILRDLGLGDRIVARHAFDTITPAEVPSAGDQAGIDYEALLRARPTHVLLQWGARDLPPRLLGLAGEHGWVVESYPLLSVEDIKAGALHMARLVGDDGAEASALAWRERINAAMRPRPEAAARAGRCLALYWTDPPGAAGPGSFHFQMLERLGVAPAVVEGGAYVTLDPEDVKRMDPDSILLLMENADEGRIDELLGPLARLGLRSVAQGRVAVVTDPLVNLPATSIAGVAEELVRDLLAMPEPAPDR